MIKITKITNIILRIIAGVGAFIIIGMVLFIANLFFGNPVSKAIADYKLQKYVHDFYSPDIKINKTYFDAPNSTYISQNDEWILKFSSNRIYDDKVSTKFRSKFRKDYSNACSIFDNTSIPAPEYCDIYTSIVPKKEYTNDINQLDVDQKIYLTSFKNSDTNISEDDSAKMAAKLTMEVIDQLGDQYNITSVEVLYMDKFGEYEITLKHTSITLDILIENTKKEDDQSIGEEEKRFIESLR